MCPSGSTVRATDMIYWCQVAPRRKLLTALLTYHSPDCSVFKGNTDFSDVSTWLLNSKIYHWCQFDLSSTLELLMLTLSSLRHVKLMFGLFRVAQHPSHPWDAWMVCKWNYICLTLLSKNSRNKWKTHENLINRLMDCILVYMVTAQCPAMLHLFLTFNCLLAVRRPKLGIENNENQKEHTVDSDLCDSVLSSEDGIQTRLCGGQAVVTIKF